MSAIDRQTSKGATIALCCRSSLGTSRRARLVQLPVAVAAVRHGVQTVLCNSYPFLDTKGGREGKRLLASLHEVRTRRALLSCLLRDQKNDFVTLALL